MESIELKIEQQVSRLCALCGPQDRRARKRVLQTIGKLKRRLSETHSSEVTNELQTSTSKELVIEQPAQLSKKHLKAKLKLLNDELAGLARKKMAQIAVKKLRAAVRRGIPVDVHSYTNVLHAFVRCNDMQEALRLADEMESVGIPPNNVTYTALLKGYCEQHDVQGALHFIRRVRVDVNTRVANTLLRGCMRTGDMLLATKIIRKIYGEWNVVKDESTVEYSVALLCQGLCLADGEAAAQAPLVSTVTSLSDSSLHPSKTTNCAVYTCLCRAALLLCEWKTAALYLECAQQLQLATKTATLRQSMLKRSRVITFLSGN